MQCSLAVLAGAVHNGVSCREICFLMHTPNEPEARPCHGTENWPSVPSGILQPRMLLERLDQHVPRRLLCTRLPLVLQQRTHLVHLDGGEAEHLDLVGNEDEDTGDGGHVP